ncbi:MAG: winged helix-turn-helix transcriptional regulator [Candidatus Lokiarchaeota archaeon]|nr:winged helix-turn-helix transcriptional regulator [Candidatus Lokiarchaeota archaeon]
MKKIKLLVLLIFSLLIVSLFQPSLSLSHRNFNKGNLIKNSNTIIISEDVEGYLWNDNNSINSDIFIDSFGRFHIVWEDNTDGVWGSDVEIMYASSLDGLSWSNATVISDGFNGVYWNDRSSANPSISVNNNGTIFVVWEDNTDGIWGSDTEIMCTSSLDGISWSNATVISDGFDGIYWNNGVSTYPDMVIDNSNTIHIVWEDETDGIWGSDTKIMYISSLDGKTWSNASVISDEYNGVKFYSRDYFSPRITFDDNGKLYLVWCGNSDGIWGDDMDILYSSSLDGKTWLNATVISDGYNGTEWNNGWSYFPSIAVNHQGEIFVVWMDETDGIWGNNTEIMSVYSNDGYSWSNATIISDDETKWNNRDNWLPNIVMDDLGNPYVSWQGHTSGIWGSDPEIMLNHFNNATGWSNITIISDDNNKIYWNDDNSANPSMAFDPNGNLHIIWSDATDGSWGDDIEIMYITLSLESIDYSIDFFYVNLILTMLILGIGGCILFNDNKSIKKLKTIKKNTLVNGINLILNAGVITLQYYQINYNYRNNIGLFSNDFLIFIIPYFLLLIALVILILISFSMGLTLKEYRQYLKSRDTKNEAFPKINFDKIFDNENRQNIIEKILSNSEIHFKELLRECNLSNGQLQWHLRVLLEHEIIKKRKIGQYNIFYPISEKNHSKKYKDKLIKSETSLKILDIIENQPGIIPKIIANRLNFKPSTINYHIRKLEKKKLITSTRNGRFLNLYLKNNEFSRF